MSAAVNSTSLLEWWRGPRSAFTLTTDKGVYALFLRKGLVLAGVTSRDDGLLYIGKAEGSDGFKGRCHFDARTKNHSPRKSLAVLLLDKLGLTPVLVSKPNSASTWGLDQASDARLSEWMYSNLDLALEVCAEPDRRESELVARFAPVLNVNKCEQGVEHRRISALRSSVLTRLKP